jgi:hypothetical protein
MTKFADQLFDDLMQEHGPALAAAQVTRAPKRRVAHPVRLSAMVGSIAAVGTAVGLLLGGSASPAYAATANANGSVTLDVYNQSGIAGANQALRKMGHGNVVVAADRNSCRSINSLPTVPGDSLKLVQGVIMDLVSKNSSPVAPGSFTVNAPRIPRGDTLVIVVEFLTVVNGKIVSVPGDAPKSAKAFQIETVAASRLTRGPVPSCLSVVGGSAASAK